jgi:hypothetical protein
MVAKLTSNITKRSMSGGGRERSGNTLGQVVFRDYLITCSMLDRKAKAVSGHTGNGDQRVRRIKSKAMTSNVERTLGGQGGREQNTAVLPG